MSLIGLVSSCLLLITRTVALHWAPHIHQSEIEHWGDAELTVSEAAHDKFEELLPFLTAGDTVEGDILEKLESSQDLDFVERKSVTGLKPPVVELR